jgi:hypothetical protein
MIVNIKKNIIYSIGVNLYNTDLNMSFKSHTPQTIHAEHNAIYKLPYNHKKRRKVIDIIVFRTNKKGNSLLMSKSCQNCLTHLERGIINKNYKLRDFYYTDKNTLYKDKLFTKSGY